MVMAWLGSLISVLASNIKIFGHSNAATNTNQQICWFFINAILLLRVCGLIEWNILGSQTISSALLWIQRYAAGPIATDLAWSLYAVIFFNQVNNIKLLFSNIIISSLACASASLPTYSRFAAISYSIVLLVPISLMRLFAEQHY